MTNLTQKRLAQIKARCEAVAWPQDIPDLFAEIERLTKNLDSQIRANRIHAGDIISANNEADRFISENYDLQAEVERLEPALRNLYNDCRNESCDKQRGKVIDEARKALETT